MTKTADLEVCLYSRANKPTIETLQCAWKVLLHRYIYTETVSFVVVTHARLKEASPHQDNAFQGWKMQASLRQFHNVSLNTLAQSHFNAEQPLSPQNFKSTQVNTAIQVCRSITHGGPGKQAQLKPVTTFSYEGVMYAVRPTPLVFANLGAGRHHPLFSPDLSLIIAFIILWYEHLANLLNKCYLLSPSTMEQFSG